MGGGDSNINGDGGSSSSGEEDGDAAWKAAINSVATVGFGLSASNGRPKPDPTAVDSSEDDDDDAAARLHQQGRSQAPKLKLYQIKAQKILDDLLDRSLVMVRNPIPSVDEFPQSDEAGIRLFSNSPAGIISDPVGINLLQFKGQIESVVLNGNDVMATAAEACKRALARSEAKEAAAKAAARREEERVSELKKARGEKWLPSVAKYMQVSDSYYYFDTEQLLV
ncbi:hypothetical protein MUK42_31993 [Musa troglodytarum]|uniref:Uncharacterized protein n=1 Tax=Musa troglodytarum TaxID=320322 RepID=A0A9E7JYH6_9LILI|nr:hypothetical protein MUK42_31993 [Musa troglodytarum]